MDSALNPDDFARYGVPEMAKAMSAMDYLQCSCGFLAFRCLHFPEPGVMRLTCSGCGKTHDINVSAASNFTAWQKAEQEVPLPFLPEADQESEPEQLQPVKSGYKYESMF